MLKRFRALFEQQADPGGGPASAVDASRLAAAALMVEAATLDGEAGADELETIGRLLRERFALGEEEAGELLAEARAVQGRSGDLVRLTRAIKDSYPPDERVRIIEMLWEVAYADGELHTYEANLLRRVAGLIYVSDQDSGAARKRVMARLGLGDDLAEGP